MGSPGRVISSDGALLLVSSHQYGTTRLPGPQSFIRRLRLVSFASQQLELEYLSARAALMTV